MQTLSCVVPSKLVRVLKLLYPQRKVILFSGPSVLLGRTRFSAGEPHLRPTATIYLCFFFPLMASKYVHKHKTIRILLTWHE